MNNALTDITLVVDRSGSMAAIREDAEGGINTFVAEQCKQSGEAMLTLVQFDTKYEFLYRGAPIREVAKYELLPRGSTALLDAIGRAIVETGARLARMPESERPGLVVFVITTDGQENASREFTKPQIKQMIEHQQQKYGWQFTFLGANQDAFAEAHAMGIRETGVSNVAQGNFDTAYLCTSNQVSRMRTQQSQNEVVSNAFKEEELKGMQ